MSDGKVLGVVFLQRVINTFCVSEVGKETHLVPGSLFTLESIVNTVDGPGLMG